MMRREKGKNPRAVGQPATLNPDVNRPDRAGWTQLMRACIREQLDKIRALTTAGADVNKADVEGFGPIMCACAEGRADVVQFLLSRGAKVDHADELGRTPLSWAVTKGDFHEAAELLISAGADVNRTDGDGFTPLMRAALMDHVRCFELLIRNGAETAPVNPHWRKTALEMAVERGSDELRRLVERIHSGDSTPKR